MGLSQVYAVVSRNFTSLLVPTFVLGCIAIDLNNSRQFKLKTEAEEAEKAAAEAKVAPAPAPAQATPAKK